MNVWPFLCDMGLDAWLGEAPEVADMLFKQPAAQESEKDFPEGPRGSTICGWTMRALSGLRLLLGDGSPDAGDRFATSGSMFDDVSIQVAALVPDGGWQGSAAQAYSAQNRAQSKRAKTMGDLDRLTGNLVSLQAEAVRRVNTVLNAEMAAVAGTFAFCIYCEVTMGPAGQIMSLQVAISVCTVAIVVLAGFLIDLLLTTTRNASEAHKMTRKLTSMVTALPASCETILELPVVVVPPAQSVAAYNLGAGYTAPRSAVELPADVSVAFADLPGSPESSVPALPTPGFPDFGARELRIPQLAGTPSLPKSLPAGVPTPQAFTGLPHLAGDLIALPTMAQLTATLSQLTQLSGAASGHTQVIPTAGQQTKIMCSPAQQGAHPQETLAGHVTDQDNAGAAPSTTAAQRAVHAAPSPTRQIRPGVL